MRDLKSSIKEAVPVIKDAAQSVADWSEPHLSNLLERAGSIARDPNWFVDAEETLGNVVSAILQTNKSTGAKALDAIVAKGAGAAGVTGVLGLVSSLGTASTGTAIASLSGAAATTAKLYWIGALVGGGVAAGGTVVAGAGIGIAWWSAKRWRGKVRTVDSLCSKERVILGTIERLLPALREEAGRTRELSSEEVSALSAIWNDLTREVKEYDRNNDLAHKHKLSIKLTARRMEKLGRNIIPEVKTS